jgi:anaerobic selenocysteine-containing dehydrogenase
MSDLAFLDRRGFLKGSVLFAAAAGLSFATPARAQSAAGREPAQPAPSEDKKAEPPKQDPPAEARKNALVDGNGREYRICDMCGGNMYVEEMRWTCAQCGFSYEA